MPCYFVHTLPKVRGAIAGQVLDSQFKDQLQGPFATFRPTY